MFMSRNHNTKVAFVALGVMGLFTLPLYADRNVSGRSYDSEEACSAALEMPNKTRGAVEGSTMASSMIIRGSEEDCSGYKYPRKVTHLTNACYEVNGVWKIGASLQAIYEFDVAKGRSSRYGCVSQVFLKNKEITTFAKVHRSDDFLGGSSREFVDAVEYIASNPYVDLGQGRHASLKFKKVSRDSEPQRIETPGILVNFILHKGSIADVYTNSAYERMGRRSEMSPYDHLDIAQDAAAIMNAEDYDSK